MGKRQLGELQPFEFVITLIIADLATIPMAEINTPLVHGIVPLFTLSILHFLISILSQKSTKARKIINGNPIIVISPNGIEYDNLKMLNMNIDDLTEAMREANYFSLDEVYYGIIETNGKLSIMPKAENSPLCSKDLKIKKQESFLQYTVISGGKIDNSSLKVLNLNQNDITQFLNSNTLNPISSIIILTIDQNGNVLVQQKGKKIEKYHISVEEINQ